MSDDSGEYSLVMPFVCTSSAGGRYDDRAFAAGVRFGFVHAYLEAKPPHYEFFGETVMRDQYDLLAMAEGYTLECEPWDDPPEDWAWYTFRLSSVDLAEVSS